MKHENRLNSSSTEQENTLGSQQRSQKCGHQFASAEEMLRHNALHTPVPPSIARRLQQSIGCHAPASSSWWRRFFRSNS
jgi:hypothetical protein